MSQPSGEPLVETIEKLRQDLDAIDDQLQALQAEGMNQLLPWRYLALQPQVDRLLNKQHALQDAWNQAMYELARCRSGQPSPDHP